MSPWVKGTWAFVGALAIALVGYFSNHEIFARVPALGDAVRLLDNALGYATPAEAAANENDRAEPLGKPDAYSLYAVFCASDFVHNGNLLTGSHGVSGDEFSAPSVQRTMWISEVRGAVGAREVGAGSGTVVQGEYGTLAIFSNGSYVYVLEEEGERVDTFEITFRNGGSPTLLVRQFSIAGVRAYKNTDWIQAHAHTSGTEASEVLAAYSGGEANDVDGRGGDDAIFAWSGDDILMGGDGNDVLMGELGSDIYKGGSGADIFSASRSDLAKSSNGEATFDTILDFSPSERDVIDLTSLHIAGPTQIRVSEEDPQMIQVVAGAAGAWTDAVRVMSSTPLDVSALVSAGLIVF